MHANIPLPLFLLLSQIHISLLLSCELSQSSFVVSSVFLPLWFPFLQTHRRCTSLSLSLVVGYSIAFMLSALEILTHHLHLLSRAFSSLPSLPSSLFFSWHIQRILELDNHWSRWCLQRSPAEHLQESQGQGQVVVQRRQTPWIQPALSRYVTTSCKREQHLQVFWLFVCIIRLSALVLNGMHICLFVCLDRYGVVLEFVNNGIMQADIDACFVCMYHLSYHGSTFTHLSFRRLLLSPSSFLSSITCLAHNISSPPFMPPSSSIGSDRFPFFFFCLRRCSVK